jgi:Fe-S cluster assembly protein SufD
MNALKEPASPQAGAPSKDSRLSPSEPAFARSLREAALEAYAALPLPRYEDEAWRRTDISLVDPDQWRADGAPLKAADAVPSLFSDGVAADDACALFQDDAFTLRLSDEWRQKGVILCDLSTAIKEHGALVEKYFQKIVPAQKGKFEAMSGAFWTRGIFLYVPKGVDLTVPVHGGFGATQKGAALLTRTLIVLEAGARATYFDEAASTGGAYDAENPAPQSFSSGGVEMALADDAQLTYLNIQRWGEGHYHFLAQNAKLSRNAKLFTLAIALGAEMSKVNMGSELAGEGAESNLYGLVFGDKSQAFTHHTHQDHQSPNTSSDLLIKTAMMGESKSIFVGMIRIDMAAQKTDAKQANRNMLLSKDARANSIPMLEILADDVKCSHGATVGSLDEDQKFYLMARGIDRSSAERVIVEGFFEDVVQKIPAEATRDKIRAAIQTKLGLGGE